MRALERQSLERQYPASSIDPTNPRPLQKQLYVTRQVLLFWVLFLAIMINVAPIDGFRSVLLSTDDAMRLVTVRELLANWDWFNFYQPRLNSPEGVVMHWSRLVDAPLALLILFFENFVTRETAEQWVLHIWPLSLLFVLLLVSSFLSLHFTATSTGTRNSKGTGIWPAVILPVCFVPLLSEFRLGRLDHHNLQIILTLLLLLSVVQSFRRANFALFAGFIAATMMAIGVETLAFVALAIMAYGLRWLCLKAGEGDRLLRFALSFGFFTAALFFLTTSYERYTAAMCDALSPVYLLASVLTMVCCIVLVSIGKYLQTTQMRLTAGGVLTVAAVGLLGIFYPACLSGPYSEVDPDLTLLWMTYVSEARNILHSVWSMPQDFAIYYLMPAIALSISLSVVWFHQDERFWDWLTLLLFLALAFAISLVQIRGAKFAGALAIPVAAWLIAEAQRYWQSDRNLVLRLGAVMASWLLFLNVFHILIFQTLAKPVAQQKLNVASSVSNIDMSLFYKCTSETHMQDLNMLPKGLVLSSHILGPHILLHTHHNALSAPYHRNKNGILDAIFMFNKNQNDAHALIKKRGVSYIILCDGHDVRRHDGKVADNALSRLFLLASDLPDWLEPVPLQSQNNLLKVYSVKN